MPNGVLIIADISGYTSFLSHSELEPAAELIRALVNIMIDNTRPPLRIARLEGDAVVSYALEDSFLRGQTLVEMIEDTYVAFRQALDQLVLNNRCDCNACLTVPDLDLKFFVHYGAFLLQPFGDRYTELIGSDVNLIHRLTKNHIKEKIGRPAYVAYTEQAVHHLEIEDLAAQMAPLVETYEHIGEILVFVQDMHEVWEEKRRERPLEVSEEEALACFNALFPTTTVLLWDHVTTPENRSLLAGMENAEVIPQSSGRIGAGSAYRCIDGRHVSLHTIRSWDPPRQYTYESERPFGTQGWTTIRLQPEEDKTRLTILIGRSVGKNGAVHALLDPVYRRVNGRKIRAGLLALRETVEAELGSGLVPIEEESCSRACHD